MSKKTQILNSLRDYSISSEQYQDEDVSSIQKRIEELFLRYKIGCLAITYSIGPTVIRFEIVPDDNYRLSIIKKLKNEMEISLSPRGTRIIAPVPGKGTVAIEFPRSNPRIVGLKQILESAEFNDDSLCLPIACGIDTNNKPIVADLAKMPHLLIGGATGQGKTNFLNILIASLLNVKSPDAIKFLLIDPKMVEFGIYEKIKDQYLLNIECVNKGVINNSEDTVLTLDALVDEMDRRYCLLQKNGCRDISAYNRNADIEKLPYIVGVIDEYADLKMALGRSIESPLIRLAAKSRAVGIHLIVATQRPSTNVITGAMKANFPCRIAFKTAQSFDSKVIIDCEGAEKLIGRGDMLLLSEALNRVQTPFIDYDEISDICADISSDTPTDNGQLDSLFTLVAFYVLGKRDASVSDIEKSFDINSIRAAKIVDQLEAEGIINKATSNKPCTCLISVSDILKKYHLQ